ncbi:hypothetical protein CRE_03243 [Caenorhabditis remanei]|uniref:Uncharacterized protein n=1 Tax=Caenorhabditis remanei TaxID=31234 RepID=E3MMJ2_CAERE|nr:hypothetical protein CRE_03243 [Caenorhabditis remanei]
MYFLCAHLRKTCAHLRKKILEHIKSSIEQEEEARADQIIGADEIGDENTDEDKPWDIFSLRLVSKSVDRSMCEQIGQGNNKIHISINTKLNIQAHKKEFVHAIRINDRPIRINCLRTHIRFLSKCATGISTELIIDDSTSSKIETWKSKFRSYLHELIIKGLIGPYKSELKKVIGMEKLCRGCKLSWLPAIRVVIALLQQWNVSSVVFKEVGTSYLNRRIMPCQYDPKNFFDDMRDFLYEKPTYPCKSFAMDFNVPYGTDQDILTKSDTFVDSIMRLLYWTPSDKVKIAFSYFYSSSHEPKSDFQIKTKDYMLTIVELSAMEFWTLEETKTIETTVRLDNGFFIDKKEFYWYNESLNSSVCLIFSAVDPEALRTQKLIKRE